MPANPTPQYRIKFNGQYLPGYVQNEDLPFNMRNTIVDLVNRDGGPVTSSGAAIRDLSIDITILSRLGTTSTGLQHLGDCLEQYREAMRITARVSSASTLYLGPMDHYLLAKFNRASAPLTAGESRRLRYQVAWDVQPFFYGATVSTSKAISGVDTITLNISDTNKTYPTIRIPSGITAITVSHSASGKSVTVSGSHTGALDINCADLTISDSTGSRIDLLASTPDFGISHTTGSGSITLATSGVIGSGTVEVFMTPRIER